MKHLPLVIPFALCLLLAAACAHTPKPAPPRAPLPAEIKKQDEQLKAEIAKIKIKLRKKDKVGDANQACGLYLLGALQGDGELLELLKQSGADVNARNTFTQETALYLAVMDGNPKGVRQLLKLGADARIENPRGRSALYEAVCADNTEVTRLLLENGANPNTVEKDFGTTPLLSAALDGKTEIIGLLLKHGADPNLGSGRGGATALHMAAMKGHQAAVELLLKHDANPNARTAAGTTPLKTATDNNQLEVIAILKKYGAN